MTIDFFDPSNRLSYASRSASSEWKALMQSVADLRDIDVADIGAAGGSTAVRRRRRARRSRRGFLRRNAVGSRQSKDGASDPVDSGRRRRQRPPGFVLRPGVAAGGDLPLLREKRPGCLRNPIGCFVGEAGSSSRTAPRKIAGFPVAPIISAASSLNGFPGCWRKKTGAAPICAASSAPSRKRVFTRVKTRRFWETRKVFLDFGELEKDFLGRIGRFIFHRLSDEELRGLVGFIGRPDPPRRHLILPGPGPVQSLYRH